MTSYLHRTCFWCGRVLDPSQITRDHLIPSWACQLFRELPWANSHGNVVPSCSPCNANKGGMPPETFHRVRLQSGLRKASSDQWHHIQRTVYDEIDIEPELRKYIIEEMLKPVPGHVVHPRVVSPLEEELDRERYPKRIPATTGRRGFTPEDVAMLNKRPKAAYTVGQVPGNTALKHEELNDNLKEDR